MEIKGYSRKDPNVDAVQVTKDNIQQVAAWCNGRVRDIQGLDGIKVVELVTRGEVTKVAVPDEYVVRYFGGEFDVKNPHVFEREYELARG